MVEDFLDGWTTYGKSYRDFENDDLNDTGTLVVIGGSTYLLGDTNRLGGICDDCVAFERDEIVEKYKKVIDKTW